MAATPQDVVGYWLNAGPQKWFAKSAAFDEALRLRFEPVHFAAARGEYDAWAATAEGALALVLLLDQIPRNLFRNSAHAFATDSKARAVARTAIDAGHDRAVAPELRRFFYLPFEHSEDLVDQNESLRLFARLRDETGDTETYRYAEIHEEIIARFGRFPHRNACMGRTTTAEEHMFLESGGFSG